MTTNEETAATIIHNARTLARGMPSDPRHRSAGPMNEGERERLFRAALSELKKLGVEREGELAEAVGIKEIIDVSRS